MALVRLACVFFIAFCVLAEEADVPPDPVGENLVIEYSEPGDSINQQIVGGENANINDHPHQVQLLMNGGLRCGGSILAKKYVVTAAHCTNGINVNSLSIRAGSSTRSGGTVIRVNRVTQHPSYNTRSLDYDIAILRLASDLTYRAGINKIALATANPADRQMMQVTGWGRLRENGGSPNTLQMARLPYVAYSRCALRYRLTNRMVCAGGEGRDSCNGDSGGPLTYNNRLVGIVSFGVGCARPNYPGVYASVVSLRTWINNNVVYDS